MRALRSNQCRRSRPRAFQFRSRAIRSLPLLLLGTLISCSSMPGPMTGTWAVVFTSGDSLQQTAASLSLQQSGTTLSGTITTASCTTPPSITGTLKNNSLSFRVLEPTASGDLTGTPNTTFTSAAGTYVISGQSCMMNSGAGTWSATFVGS